MINLKYLMPIALLSIVFSMESFGNEYPLRAAIEACLIQKTAEDYPAVEDKMIATYFLPDSIYHGVVATVLGESIATHSSDDRIFIIGVGGTIDPPLLATGLRVVLDRFAMRTNHSKSKWPGVTLVYYTHHKTIRELRSVVEEFGMKLDVRIMDSRTKSGLIESGCKLNANAT